MQEPPPQGDPRSDAELIDAVRSGDPIAFGYLYSRHSAATTAMARYYARDNFTADDLVSEAFERTYAVLRGGGGPDVSFRAYIYTAVRRLGYEQTKKGRKTQVTDDFSAFEVPDDDVDPAVSSFERTLVTGAFATLPERWQAVLWYLEVEGMSPPEVAPMLGLTPNGVSALAYRAREGLREAYLQAHVATVPVRPDCEQLRGKLGTHARGGLPRRDETKVVKHCETCAECAAIVAELRDVGHSMRAIIGPFLLGGSAVAGLGWGATAGTGTASAAVVAVAPTVALGVVPVAVPLMGAVVGAVAAVAAAAIIATALVFSGSPGDEPPADAAAEPIAGAPFPEPTPTRAGPRVLTAPTPRPGPTNSPPISTDPVTRVNPLPGPAPDPAPSGEPELTFSMADAGNLVLGRDGLVGVTLSNTGAVAATSISISVLLPTGVTIDPARAIGLGGASTLACVPLAATALCTAPTLAAGTAVTIYLPVRVSIYADTTTAPSAAMSASGQPTQRVAADQPAVAGGLSARVILNGRYAETTTGASFVSCDTTDPTCVLAQNRTLGLPLDNNNWTMIAQDGAGTGSVSSTTRVSIPSAARVAFAGLYWSSLTPAGASDSMLATAQLRAPDGSVTSVEAARVDHGLAELGDSYQSMADVTSVVESGGSGAWALSGARIGPGAASNPGAPVGRGVYGGWSLVVVYEDPSLSVGQVAVFDGFEILTNETSSFVLAGIPNSTAAVSAVAWEGDVLSVGDTVAIDGTTLTRTVGSGVSNNVFDSTAAGSSTPNSFGVDAGTFVPVLVNRARAVMTVTSAGDYFTVAAVAVTSR